MGKTGGKGRWFLMPAGWCGKSRLFEFPIIF